LSDNNKGNESVAAFMEAVEIIQIQKLSLCSRQIIDALSYPKSSGASTRCKNAMLCNLVRT
jgi:hypothetical protein